MNNSMLICRFCNSSYKIYMYTSKCEVCKIQYMVRFNSHSDVYPNIYSSDTNNIIIQSYGLDDSIVHNLDMHLINNITTIWYHPVAPLMKRVSVPGTWPQTSPEEALALARRLMKLIVFS